jgi:hypothetical protein
MAAMELRKRLVTAEQFRKFEGYAAEIFSAFGLNLNTPATPDTPRRFIEALHDATEGYDGDPNLLRVFETECRGEPDWCGFCPNALACRSGSASRSRMRWRPCSIRMASLYSWKPIIFAGKCGVCGRWRLRHGRLSGAATTLRTRPCVQNSFRPADCSAATGRSQPRMPRSTWQSAAASRLAS